MAKAPRNGEDNDDGPALDRPICGIVMPISEIDDLSAGHWLEVRSIVREAADKAGFEARLVSAADYAGVILKEIIHNLYHDPIVVCDVSARNPNVMFELGLRLAFDMPTILIKDDQIEYAFDTSPIEHLEYRRDLRYSSILIFKETLAEKIEATHKRATTDKNYTPFLKHFGDFKIATVETQEVTGQEFIFERLRHMTILLERLAFRDDGRRASRLMKLTPLEEMKGSSGSGRLIELIDFIHDLPGLKDADVGVTGDGTVTIRTATESGGLPTTMLANVATKRGFKLDMNPIRSAADRWAEVSN